MPRPILGRGILRFRSFFSCLSRPSSGVGEVVILYAVSVSGWVHWHRPQTSEQTRPEHRPAPRVRRNLYVLFEMS